MLLAAGLIPSQLEIRERRANLEELRDQLGYHKHREQEEEEQHLVQLPLRLRKKSQPKT